MCNVVYRRYHLCLTLCIILAACNGSAPPPFPTPAPTMPAAQAPVTIIMARPDWPTGWFQSEIYKKLLNRLGFQVQVVDNVTPEDFYPAAARGEIHLWAHGWFPYAYRFLERDDFRGEIEAVGSQMRGGALEGYFIDKQTADGLGITRLDDLRDQDIAAIFDHDRNGKANLIGCPDQWECAKVINSHLSEKTVNQDNRLATYTLADTIEHIQGDYDTLMEEVVDRVAQGQPVLFYTWTPNWPLGRLIPGKDVMWLEVMPSVSDSGLADQAQLTRIIDVVGCASNPCQTGWLSNDIRAVANSAFLVEHPQVRRLLELIEIPQADVLNQNFLMKGGANTDTDIERHAEDWIQQNLDLVNDWVAEAQNWREYTIAEGGLLQRVKERGYLICGIHGDLPGFSYPLASVDDEYAGFDSDFCRVVATAIFGNPNQVRFIPLDARQRFAAISDRKIDVLFRNTTWNASFDVGMEPPNSGIRLAFGPTIFHDGQRFMVRADAEITQIEDFQDKTICVLGGTTSVTNLIDQFNARNIDFVLARRDTLDEVYQVYEAGGCDAVTSDSSQLISRRSKLQNTDEHIILDIQISREPLSPAFIEGDPIWHDVVNWAVFATIYAEELRVDISNVEALFAELQQSNPNIDSILIDGGGSAPDIQRLLGIRGAVGNRLGLSNHFAYDIIREFGNYRDIYNRNLGPDTAINLSAGPNKTWNSSEGPGGLLSAPPFR